MKNKLIKGMLIVFSILILSGCEPLTDGGDSGTSAQPISSSSSVSTATDEAQVPVKQSEAPANGVATKVIKVVDGDTLQVLYQKKIATVRVLLIDTPETHHPRLGVQPFGPEASAHAHQLLDGKTVTLELAKDGGRDKYGRLLAYVFVGGKSFEELQLASGLARVAYIYPPNTKYVDQYRAIEQQAQEKKIGIWSVPGYAQADGYHPAVMKGTEAYSEIKSSNDQTKNTYSKPKSSVNGQFSPDQNGDCAGSIKGNVSDRGKIYHMPSDRYYKVTKAEICFKNRDAAEKAGFRAAK